MSLISVEKIQKQACSCPKKIQSTSSGKKFLPLFSGILVALIPKCPYCILAYSSALTMCSGAKVYGHSVGWTSYLLLTLAGLTLVFILINYKGNRTLIAATLVAAGILLMFTGQFYTFNVSQYNWGTFLIFFGVWVNASFRFFYKKYISSTFIGKKILHYFK